MKFFVISGLVFIFSVCFVNFITRYLKFANIFDKPNKRSSHQVPTPRGGGLAVTPLVLSAWLLIGAYFGQNIIMLPLLLGGIGLFFVSWWDDRRDISPIIRLAAQIVFVGFALFSLPDDRLVFQGMLGYAQDRLLTGFIWIWFINSFNFMDGVDGITGVELISVGVGMILLHLTFGLSEPLGLYAVALCAAAAGFLVWNWHPAKVFLGDVGSIPLGYLTGWLLLSLAAYGYWLAALVLPLYYLADSGITLCRRLLRGERIWHAHREHFYQKAVQRGLSHSQVVLRISAANACLIILAVYSPELGIMSLVVGACIILILLRHLATVNPG